LKVNNRSEAMNVANLQLEGLLMAIASINHVLVRKGLVTIKEIDAALRRAEASGTSEERSDDVSSANRDCNKFPDQAAAISQSVSAGNRRTAIFRAHTHGRSDQPSATAPSRWENAARWSRTRLARLPRSYSGAPVALAPSPPKARISGHCSRVD
jgi:hypothetical protein